MAGPTVLANDSACMSSQPAQAGAWHTAGLLLSHGTHRHSAGSPSIRIPALRDSMLLAQVGEARAPTNPMLDSPRNRGSPCPVHPCQSSVFLTDR